MSNRLIKKTNWKIVSLKKFSGVCHLCNSPIFIDEEVLAVEFENTETYWHVVPINIYDCPNCGETMKAMMLYKSLEVTKELSKV